MYSKSLIVSLSLICSAALLFSACSSESYDNENPERLHKFTALELYTARASLTDTSFEQFSLVKNQLYIECGQIHRSRNAVAEQKTETLSNEDLLELESLLASVEVSPLEGLPEPGHVNSMFGDGKFLLSTHGEQSLKIETTLDDVSNKSSRAARALHKVYAFLRGIPTQAPCGKKTFYGVGTPPAPVFE